MTAGRPDATDQMDAHPAGQEPAAPLLEAVGITAGYDGIPAVQIGRASCRERV